jgi:hypothetical protein
VAMGAGSASFQAPLDDVRIAFSEPWLELGQSFFRTGGVCHYVEGGVLRWSAGGEVADRNAETATLAFLKLVAGAFENHNRRVMHLYGLDERSVYARLASPEPRPGVVDRLYGSVKSYPLDRPDRVTLIRRLML